MIAVIAWSSVKTWSDGAETATASAPRTVIWKVSSAIVSSASVTR